MRFFTTPQERKVIGDLIDSSNYSHAMRMARELKVFGLQFLTLRSIRRTSKRFSGRPQRQAAA